MSFPRARIIRFNEVKSAAPPVGRYDPKLNSMVRTGGHTLYRLSRFSKENVSKSPTPTSGNRSRQGNIRSPCPGPSRSAPRRPQGASLPIRSSSMFSLLPSEIEREYRQSESGTEFEVKAVRNLDIEFLQASDAELQESKYQHQIVRCENEKLSKQLNKLRQDLTDAETRIVESDKIVEQYRDNLKDLEENSQTDCEIQKLQGQLDIHLKLNVELQNQLQQSTIKYDEISASNRSWNCLKEEVELFKEKNETLNSFLEASTERCNELESMNNQKDQDLSYAKQGLEAEKTKVTVLQTTLKRKEAELLQSESILLTYRNSLQEKESFIEETVKSLEITKTEIHNLHSDYLTRIKELEFMILKLNSELKNTKEELATQVTNCKQLDAQLSKKCKEFEECEQVLKETTFSVRKLEQDVNDKVVELNELKVTVVDFKLKDEKAQNVAKELERVLANETERVRNMEKLIQQSDEKLAEALRNIAKEQNQLAVMQTTLDRTKAELVDSTLALNFTTENLEKEIRLRETLTSQLNEAEDKVQCQISEYEKQTEFVQSLELQMESQFIKIADLTSELDKAQYTENQLKSHLDERTNQLESTWNELEKLREVLEEERARVTSIQNIQMQLCQEAEVRNLELESAIKSSKMWESRCEDLAEEREKLSQRLEQAEIVWEQFLALQLKLASQTSEIKNSNTEIRILKVRLDKAEQSMKNSKQKLLSSTAEISNLLAARDQLKTYCHQMTQKIDEYIKIFRTERNQLVTTIKNQNKQITEVEAVNASLKHLIGPFEDQLNLYKANLDAEKGAAAGYKEKVSHLLQEQAKLMGHQNPKQKIHHLQKLKEENDKLVNQVFFLEKEMKVKNKQIEDLQKKIGKIEPRRFDPSQAFQHRRNNNIDPENLENHPV